MNFTSFLALCLLLLLTLLRPVVAQDPKASEVVLSPEEAFLEVDRLVEAHIRTFGASEFHLASPRWGRFQEEGLPYPGDIWAYSLDSHSPETRNLWVVGVDLWTGACYAAGSLRLYRREADHLRLLQTLQDTPLYRASQGKWGREHEGCLDLCLSGHLMGLSIDAFSEEPRGLVIQTEHGHSWSCGGGFAGAVVRWIVQEERLRPVSVEYFVEPHSFTTKYNVWDRSLYRRREWLRTDTEEPTVSRTESLTPWIEDLDLVIAASDGRVAGEAVARYATPEQLRELAAYRPCWIEC